MAKTKSKPTNVKLADLNRDQLKERLGQLRADLSQQMQQLRLGASTNVRQPALIRRQIARTLTFLRKSELAEVEAGPKQTEAKGKKE